MIESLPKIVHEHHETLNRHVDALAEIAELVGSISSEELERRVAAEHEFIISHLVPHMEHAESAVYPALERLLQNRHSTGPLRHEHASLRRYIDELGTFKGHTAGFGAHLRLRRVLYRMFALIKTHLAEEEAYIGVLERNLSPAEAADVARGLEHATD